MQRSKVNRFVLILILGAGIGGVTPWLLQNFSQPNSIEGKQELPIAQDSLTQTVNSPLSSQTYYYCKIDQGILSVIEGNAQNGKRIITGLNVSKWPPEMLTMAQQIEFHSLDEVQSFIDSMSEELWLE